MWDSPTSAHKKRWGVCLPSTLKYALKMLILQFPHRAQNCRYVASFVVLLVPAFCLCLQCFNFGFFAHLLSYVIGHYKSIFHKHYKRIAVHYIINVFSHTLLFVMAEAVLPPPVKHSLNGNSQFCKPCNKFCLFVLSCLLCLSSLLLGFFCKEIGCRL